MRYDKIYKIKRAQADECIICEINEKPSAIPLNEGNGDYQRLKKLEREGKIVITERDIDLPNRN